MKLKLAALILVCSANSYSCTIQNIINDSKTTDLLLRRVHIKHQKHDTKGTWVRRKQKYADQPHVVNAQNLGLGDYLDIAAVESSTYGQICKDYRIMADEKNNKVIVQRKDGCQIDRLVYETVFELPVDSMSCAIDLYVADTASSLTIRAASRPEPVLHKKQETI